MYFWLTVQALTFEMDDYTNLQISKLSFKKYKLKADTLLVLCGEFSNLLPQAYASSATIGIQSAVYRAY